VGIRLSSGSKGYAFDNAVAESFGSLMPDLGMFEDTGALLRMPGGNVENIADQKPVISWAGLNVGGEVERDPSRWNRQLSLYADARIATLPWLHCHTLGDVDFLISVGKQWDSPAIGLNIEDVKEDGLDLSQVARHLESWTGEILMPTLPWVQNGQGWSQLARCVAALEIFPDENDDSKKPQDCIEHAFAEGLTKVTLMYKTKDPNLPEQYDLSLCHSLYTADDITPTQQAWAAWNHRGKEHPPMPPKSKSSPQASGGSNWHEKRYPKNPDPPEIAFVRPLYPPDAVEKDRTPSPPGPDVKAIKRAISHAQRFLPWSPEEWDDIYDDVIAHGDGSGIDRSGVSGFQQQMGIEPTGWVGEATFEALRTCLIPSKPGVSHAGEPVFDSVCLDLLHQAAELPAPGELPTLKPGHLIEPKQGFDSLHPSLHEAYSLGRTMGLSDLGTYNPASTLPGGGKSDHAFFPAWAFDLGIEPDTGFANPVARAFFEAMVDRPDVEYVILGDKIWSRSRGLHAYTAGGHLNHVHLSGIRER